MTQRLMRLALPLWLLLSLSLWTVLPAASLIALTPWVCGLLLGSIGLIIGLTLGPLLRTGIAAHCRVYPGLSLVAVAAAIAPPLALLYGFEMHKALNANPIVEMAGLLWMLSSMGTVLTLMVCRLLASFIANAAPSRQTTAIDEPRYTAQAEALKEYSAQQ